MFNLNIRLLSEIFLAVFILSAGISKADDDRYQKAMEQNLAMLDTASSLESFLNIANRFERIAATEKDEWLPYYYAAYNLAISSLIDSISGQKDSYLDKAENFITIADSLQKDNSEILTMMGMLAQLRLIVDPQNRWQKYGQMAENYLSKAKELDPSNPRPDFLNGQSILYTPEQFGGGKDRALPILKEAEQKYKDFKPASSIHPDWGEGQLQQLLSSISG